MKSRYEADVAGALVHELAPRASELLALRTYTARLVGSEPSLVLHGGGNTSVKATATTLLGETIDVLHVKGSGWDLATIEPEGHPAVRLAPLRKLRALDAMTDEAMVNELRINLLDAAAPNPSVETLLHALLPARFIDHTHADAILAICDQPEGERLCASIFGRGLVWVPYVMPGFALAKRCAEIFERVAAGSEPSVMVLEKHGLFTWGATAKESYERTIEAVTRAERYAVERGPTVSVAARARRATARGARRAGASPSSRRGGEARRRRLRSAAPSCVRARRPAILELPRTPGRRGARVAGCATPDHVLRTKPTALFVPDPAYDADGAALGARFEAAIAQYAREYDAYFERCARPRASRKKKLDPWPRVVLLPGFGVCALGATAVEAGRRARPLRAHDRRHDERRRRRRVRAASGARISSTWSTGASSRPSSSRRARRRSRGASRSSRARRAGSASAVAASMVAAGAHVAVVDRDAEALAQMAAGPRPRSTRAASCRSSPTCATRRRSSAPSRRRSGAWGGLDVVVSNAGAAPEGRLDTAAGQAALRESLDLNCLSHATVARLATAVMTAQGRGGCLLFNASKSAFNPGPGFGPYAVAKSALVALMRQYAVDLGPSAIRSNAVNADRIRTRLFAERRRRVARPGARPQPGRVLSREPARARGHRERRGGRVPLPGDRAAPRRAAS